METEAAQLIGRWCLSGRSGIAVELRRWPAPNHVLTTEWVEVGSFVLPPDAERALAALRTISEQLQPLFLLPALRAISDELGPVSCRYDLAALGPHQLPVRRLGGAVIRSAVLE